MILEPTTLAATARVIAETLEQEYGIDPAAVFERAGLDVTQLDVPGARYPFTGMQSLWKESVIATKDPCFGIMSGLRIRPTSFHALGFSWIASQSLLGSLRRLTRYHEVITTAPLSLELQKNGLNYRLFIEYPDPSHAPQVPSIDAFVTSIVQLCRAASNEDFAPVAIAFRRTDRTSLDIYSQHLGCPVSTGADRVTMHFDREQLETPLPGNNVELARANDRIAENYLDTLDPKTVTSEVREHLVAMLPSGDTSQNRVASRMNRSLSTLQRQLSQEGTSFKAIRDENPTGSGQAIRARQQPVVKPDRLPAWLLRSKQFFPGIQTLVRRKRPANPATARRRAQPFSVKILALKTVMLFKARPDPLPHYVNVSNRSPSVEQLLQRAERAGLPSGGDIRTLLTLSRQPGVAPHTAAGAIDNQAGLTETFVELQRALSNDQRKQSNLREAVIQNGAARALTVAAAARLLQGMQGRAGYMARAVLAGTWANLIGRAFGRRDIDLLFLAAVAEPIGIEIIRLGAPEVYAHCDPYMDQAAARTAEESVIGTNRHEIGAWYVTQAEFPEAACLAVARSHNFEAHDVDFRNRGFCRTISFATAIARAWMADADQEKIAHLARQAEKLLGLELTQFADLWADALGTVPRLNQALGRPRWPEPALEAFATRVHRMLDDTPRIMTLPVKANSAPASAPHVAAAAIMNRNEFEHRLTDELRMSDRYDWPMAVGLVRIEYDDTMESRYSDRIFSLALEAIDCNMRVSDAAGAVSPNEIAILLPAALPEESASIMEALVRSITSRVGRIMTLNQSDYRIQVGLVNRSSEEPFSTGHQILASARDSLRDQPRALTTTAIEPTRSIASS